MSLRELETWHDLYDKGLAFWRDAGAWDEADVRRFALEEADAWYRAPDPYYLERLP